MNAYPGLVGALILVPIAIAGGIAFIAVKIPDFWRKITTFFQAWSLCSRPKRKKINRSDLSTSQAYPDSWSDLESSRSLEHSILVPETRESPRRNIPLGDPPSRIWHPSRSSRLTWSFGEDQRSQSLNPCESSKGVQRPLPVALHPEKARSQNVGRQDQLQLPADRRQKAQTCL
jgi:hypothetical protein